jgi:hypothetical protein
MWRERVRQLLAVVICLALGGCAGSGGASSGTSNPEEGVYAGVIADDEGNPVSGARVSINGIEAKAITDASGSFMVSDTRLSTSNLASQTAGGIASAAALEVSVIAEGFDAHLTVLNVGPGERAQVTVSPSELEPDLEVSHPSSEQLFVVPNCSRPEVLVEGFAKLGLPDNLLVDIVLVLDRSGSTAQEAFDVDGNTTIDSVLEAEIAAARCFLGSLDFSVTRVCLMTFSDAVQPLVDFTSDVAALEAGLDSVNLPGGGTNFDAVFQTCEEAFVTLGAQDAAAAGQPEVGDLDLPSPFRAVVFLSDGITTTHGVPAVTGDSNFTQSAADRDAAIAAAESLGAATGCELFAYSFIPANDGNRRRTTLPHCIAACGGGEYADLTDVSQLQSALCGVSLISALTVELANLTTGGAAILAALDADGSFDGLVPVSIDPVDAGAPDADGVVTNTIEVTVRAFSGALEKVRSTSVTVRLMAEAVHAAKTDTELLAAQEAGEPVSQLTGLLSPTRRPLNSSGLYNFFVGQNEAEFEDAIEIFGVETLKATDPGQPNVTVTVDMVSKDACYQSDIGYFIVDPADPPSSAFEALGALAPGNALLNGGDVGPGCSVPSVPAGTATFQFTVEAGKQVAFFLIPNRTLAQYQANPGDGLQPLFTVPGLNPGGMDQTLEFRSVVGRTQAGVSQVVVTPGPMVLIAFEDIQIARRRSDQDFNDAVIAVRMEATGDLAETECEE